jgi:hypothetical protein
LDKLSKPRDILKAGIIIAALILTHPQVFPLIIFPFQIVFLLSEMITIGKKEAII